MANTSDIEFKVKAHTAELTSGLATAESSISAFATGAEAALGPLLVPLLAIAAVVKSVTFSFSALSDASDRIGALSKESQRLGVSTEQLAGWNAAAKKVGVDSEGLEKMINKFSLTVSSGSEKARDGIKKLGLNFDEIKAKDPAQRFEAIQKAIQKVGNASEKLELAKLFGGKDGMAAQFIDLEKGIEKAKKTGLAVSEVDAAKVTGFKKTMGEIWDTFQGIANDIMIAIAPGLTWIAKKALEVVQWLKSWTAPLRDFGQTVFDTAEFMYDNFYAIVCLIGDEILLWGANFDNFIGLISDADFKDFKLKVEKEENDLKAKFDKATFHAPAQQENSKPAPVKIEESEHFGDHVQGVLKDSVDALKIINRVSTDHQKKTADNTTKIADNVEQLLSLLSRPAADNSLQVATV